MLRRSGLGATTVGAIVDHSQVTDWRAEATIVGPRDSPDFIRLLVSGAARLTFQGDRKAAIIVRFIPPGEYLLTVPISGEVEPEQLSVVAHIPSTVALIGFDGVVGLLRDAAPADAAMLMSAMWCGLRGALLDRCRLIALPLQARLMVALQQLARDFGRQHHLGTLIGLEVRQDDLARLVGAERANVSRCLGKLEHAGDIRRENHQFIVVN